MSDANEPTAEGPNAPKQDRLAKARAAKAAKADKKTDDRIAALEAQIAALANVRVEPSASEPGATSLTPGEYFVGGTDAQTGRPVMRKRRWTRAEVEKRYQKVTFAPVLTTPVSPHGITYELEAGVIATVPSIVKDIHDSMVLAIRRQSEGYHVSEEQSKRTFDAARSDPVKGRHFTGLEHLGYGWPIEALTLVAQGRGNDGKAIEEIGWESEIGFPGGYGGKPLATEQKV